MVKLHLNGFPLILYILFVRHIVCPFMVVSCGTWIPRLVPGISVTAPIRRSTPWAFIFRKKFPFVPTIEMSTLFSFPSKNQINAQGAVTENPGNRFYVAWRKVVRYYIYHVVLQHIVVNTASVTNLYGEGHAQGHTRNKTDTIR